MRGYAHSCILQGEGSVCSRQMCIAGSVAGSVAVAVAVDDAVADDAVVESVEDRHNTQLLYNHLFQLVHH